MLGNRPGGLRERSAGSAMYCRPLETPIGSLLVAGDAGGLRFVLFRSGNHAGADWQPDRGRLDEPVRQLNAYFTGALRAFDLPLAPQGTDFQQRVWRELCAIPYGETISYGELARRIGNPKAVRAVGLANGANPISIVIPCHRVIGSNGSLTGYGGGLPVKQALLALERGERRLI